MRQYPIWNIITACIYKSAKSYGVKDFGKVVVKVGTSSSNSHNFLDHEVTHKELANGDRSFRFYLDGHCVKKGLLRKGATQLEVESLWVDKRAKSHV